MLSRTLIAAALAVSLGACASLNRLDNDVSTFGNWPAERKAGSFVFERLPSQQASPDRQQLLEDAARGALETAGFRASADAASADYLVQLGARVTHNDPWVHNAPLFWRGGYRYGGGWGRWPGGWGPGWGPYGAWGAWGAGYAGSVNFDREVAVLIRDHKSGQLLYEAHAVTTGLSGAIDRFLAPMYEAAMKDFPRAGPNPRNVSVQVSNAQ